MALPGAENCALNPAASMCPRCPGEPGPAGIHAWQCFALRDGRAVALRAVQPGDVAALIELHERLSHRSRYYRYFAAKPALTPSEARYFATVDGLYSFGAVALAEEADGPVVVGHAALIRTAPERGELALVVRDDHQGVGLGSQLTLIAVHTALRHRIRYVTGAILAENRAMRSLAYNRGGRASGRSGPEIHYELDVHTFRAPVGGPVVGLPAQRSAGRRRARVER